MTLGLFSGSSSRRRSRSIFGGPVEDQLSEIRGDIATLAKMLSKRGSRASGHFGAKASHVAHDVRDQAESSLSDVMDGAEQLLSDLRHRYASTEKQVRLTVREHPLATLGVAAAAGLVIVALLRR